MSLNRIKNDFETAVNTGRAAACQKIDLASLLNKNS